MSNLKKTVIHVYVTKTKSTPNPQGFADFLRGTMALHQLSLDLNFNLLVDFSHHPLDNYIQRMDSEYIGKQTNVLEFFHCIQEIPHFLKILKTCRILYVYTNCFPKKEVTQENKNFIESVLKWKDVINISLEQRLINAPLDYICLHIRLTDEEFIKSNRDLSSLYNKIETKLLPRKNVIVIANNMNVCKHVCDKYGFFYIKSKPSHMGCIYNGDVKDTVLDFSLLTRAKMIVSWCAVGHSGFSKICNQVYDTPIFDIS